MADVHHAQSDRGVTPIHIVREGKGKKLWVKEPESMEEDRTIIGARLCSCSDVCLAVMEDR